MTSPSDHTFPRQRIFGLFLCAVSIAVVLPVALPYQGQPNGALFGLAYAVAFLGVMMNPLLRRHTVPATRAQRLYTNVALALLALGATATLLLIRGQPRETWLVLFLLVGAHFLLFIPVHGRLVGVLGVAAMINGAVGLVVPALPLPLFFLIDAGLKLAAGVLYLKTRPVLPEAPLAVAPRTAV